MSPKVWWSESTDCAVIKFPNRDPIAITREFLLDSAGHTELNKGWKETASEVEAKYKNVDDSWRYFCITTSDLTELNKGEKKMNESATCGYVVNKMYPFGNLYLNPQAQAQTPSSTSNMTRLTTSGDWTIALNGNGKLVAFDSNGQSITAIGSLIYANGRAWMWNDGKLWSGVMEHVEAEAEARQREADEKRQEIFLAQQKVRDKYNEKIQDLIEKKIAALDAIAKP